MRLLTFSMITMLCASCTTQPKASAVLAPPPEALQPAPLIHPVFLPYKGTTERPQIECAALLACWTTWKERYLQFLLPATTK